MNFLQLQSSAADVTFSSCSLQTTPTQRQFKQSSERKLRLCRRLSRPVDHWRHGVYPRFLLPMTLTFAPFFFPRTYKRISVSSPRGEPIHIEDPTRERIHDGRGDFELYLLNRYTRRNFIAMQNMSDLTRPRKGRQSSGVSVH